MSADDDSFDAPVWIGKGNRATVVLEPHGHLKVTKTVLRLSRRDGQVIASAPLSSIWMKKLRFPFSGVHIWIDGTRYKVSGGPPDHAGSALDSSVKWARTDRNFVDAFIAWISERGGNVGSPP